MLQFMGLQRVRHDWATELNWTEHFFLILKISISLLTLLIKIWSRMLSTSSIRALIILIVTVLNSQSNSMSGSDTCSVSSHCTFCLFTCLILLVRHDVLAHYNWSSAVLWWGAGVGNLWLGLHLLVSLCLWNVNFTCFSVFCFVLFLFSPFPS